MVHWLAEIYVSIVGPFTIARIAATPVICTEGRIHRDDIVRFPDLSLISIDTT